MEKALKITTNKDKKADRIFWETKSFTERLEAIELLREQYFSINKNAPKRFQRVCRIIKAKG
ncbi:MAG TPA: toxin secretion, membrane fusion protein [Bacteroidia bacterium]|jgi:hypothetical protein|nr:toxin secretion, membrane fusion protein [Bacteroidia bacterium]